MESREKFVVVAGQELKQSGVLARGGILAGKQQSFLSLKFQVNNFPLRSKTRVDFNVVVISYREQMMELKLQLVEHLAQFKNLRCQLVVQPTNTKELALNNCDYIILKQGCVKKNRVVVQGVNEVQRQYDLQTFFKEPLKKIFTKINL